MLRTTSFLAVLMVLLGVGRASAATMPIAIGHWNFDEGAGVSAIDSAPGSNNGTIHGATYVPGRVGSHALWFDGMNDYVDVGVASDLDLAGTNYTVAWWNKWGGENAAGFGTGQGIQRIVTMNDGNDQSGGYSFYRGAVYDSSLSLEHSNGYNNNVYTGHLLPLHTWEHVAVTYDFSTGQRTLYVNGNVEGSFPIVGGYLTSDGDDRLLFGAIDNTPGFGIGQFFHGAIDDIRIYDSALNNDDVRALVPEPSTAVLLCMGAIGLAVFARRRNPTKRT